MPNYRGRDWDCRSDGFVWTWKVFGQPGEPLVVERGFAPNALAGVRAAKRAVEALERAPAAAREPTAA